ncbi:MAG: hypothetical protein JW850_19470 [Thermoflexales bacterium]|nr:hypothetical protein [Thermoflexales bacterium]
MKLQAHYGILVVVGIGLAAMAACASPPTGTPMAPRATATQTPDSSRPTPTDIPWPTRLPTSYFSITVALTTTATDLRVGDVVTMFLTVTNTGKLYFHRPHGSLTIFLEDGKTWQPSSDPILEFVTPRVVDFKLPAYNLNPGESIRVTFVLRAARPGTVIVRGGSGGEVYYVPAAVAATLSGRYATPFKVYVYPANP